ncbi:unnamed protein product [Cladocopium goreaui]|uniref:Protein MEI2-like 2 n=1 Tax=Cladocopium goreaui TaxID=2562237 RepID=A0A9P1DGM7_9DINO|nr:unnamed protein product [Cladocopium goreaui]
MTEPEMHCRGCYRSTKVLVRLPNALNWPVHNVWNLQLCRSICSSADSSNDGQEINFNLLGFQQNEVYPGWIADETGHGSHGQSSRLLLAIVATFFRQIS